MTIASQNQRVLTHLSQGQSIDPLAAIAMFGIYRLGARIFDLKQSGHAIHKDMIEVRNRYGGVSRIARYSLVQTSKP